MENDLVKRIRESTGGFDAPGTDTRGLMDEAADEIERLRAALTIVVRNTPPLTIAHTAAAAALCRPSVTADEEQG